MRNGLWLVLLSIGLAGVGCGESNADSQPPFRSSLDGSRTLDSLAPAEGDAFCKEFVAGKTRMYRSQQGIEGVCLWRGRMATEGLEPGAVTTQICETTKRACQEELAVAEVPSTCEITFPTTCAASIDEFNACMNANAASFDSAIVAIRECADADDIDEAAAKEVLRALREGCNAYQTKCPRPTTPQN
ncbi:MAG: hypothetical protein ABUR63_09860 [Verrucomicrobiota bacterium]